MKKFIFIILLVFLLVFIFVNSAQAASDSSGYSKLVTERLIKLFVRDFDSLSQSERNGLVDRFEHGVRKLAHFCEYAALGFVLTLCLFELSKLGGRARLIILCSIAICCVYAITDEVHQLFVPGRTARVTDVLIDTAGAALGSLIAAWIHITLRKIRDKKRNRTH